MRGDGADRFERYKEASWRAGESSFLDATTGMNDEELVGRNVRYG